ncbi:30S ribosomal protein S18 [Mycobacterium avium subsp. paratuberculosis S5]|nr:30S ribosomal protein S18 [Mycobacterium avium subsp. paratuberculosis S5]
MRTVDYKDTATLRVFISERGKIRSRQVTGLSVQQQRQVATAIKNAREMALLPYRGKASSRNAACGDQVPLVINELRSSIRHLPSFPVGQLT